MIFDDEKMNRLYRKCVTTAKCKHNASERLKKHHLLSQWTLAFISTVLIMFPLMGTPNLDESNNDSRKIYEAIQVGFAVLVLVASQLIGALSFSLRSYRFHSCGIELDQLSYKISNLIKEHDFYDLYKKYISILEKYENHKTIDYVKSKRAMKNIYYQRPGNKLIDTYAFDTILHFFMKLIEFLPYLITPIFSVIILMSQIK